MAEFVIGHTSGCDLHEDPIILFISFLVPISVELSCSSSDRPPSPQDQIRVDTFSLLRKHVPNLANSISNGFDLSFDCCSPVICDRWNGKSGSVGSRVHDFVLSIDVDVPFTFIGYGDGLPCHT